MCGSRVGYVRFSPQTTPLFSFTNLNLRGTGASAIYPLLACSLEPTWKFVAAGHDFRCPACWASSSFGVVELDSESYTHAQHNVRTNALSDRIRVVKVEDNANEDGQQFGFDRLLGGCSDKRAGAAQDTSSMKDEVEIQFTMCNPPFYSSVADIAESEARKEHSAFGVCTGAPVEMITPGGEVRFVSGMIRESLYECRGVGMDPTRDDDKARKKRRLGKGSVLLASGSPTTKFSPYSELRWYTSMLGKMGSVVEVVGVLKELGITNYAITEFIQGHTRRWAVGWCLGGWRLNDDIVRIMNPNPTLKRLLPPRNTLQFEITKDQKNVYGCLESLLHSIEGATVAPDDGAEPEGNVSSYVVSLTCDTWSRGARRKRKKEQENAVDGAIDGDYPPGLVSSIVLRLDRMQLYVRWLYGKERSLLESFASHVAQKLNNNGG
ncbi:hypothetical protein C0992_008563 [Termitomyces sp. T32_za158]|nr:hypothetical protein C0992_008563 [Termitomyces sp. T32_za158]